MRDAIRRLRHTGPWPIVAILSSGGHALLDWPEIVLRLGVATLAGGLIGLNRDLHGKPIGLNTLGLVGLATALVVALADPSGDTTKISPKPAGSFRESSPASAFSGRASSSAPNIISDSRPDQRRLYLAHGLRRYRLRGRAMADCRGRACDYVRASDRRPSARALAPSRARRQGRSGVKIPRLDCAGGYAARLAHDPQVRYRFSLGTNAKRLPGDHAQTKR